MVTARFIPRKRGTKRAMTEISGEWAASLAR
jgi:hypothetical protein